MGSITSVLFELDHGPQIKTHNHFRNVRKLGWKIETSVGENIVPNAEPSPTVYELADVYINNAPLANMLLGHTRVHGGIRECDSLKDLGMTVSINLIDHQLHTGADDQGTLYRVLSYVRHVTLFLELSPDTTYLELVGREKDKITELIARIADTTPYAKTFRIAVKYPRGLISDTELQDQIRSFNSGSLLLTDPFNTFDHLRLTQVGKGCGVGYGGVALHKPSKHPGCQTFVNGSGYPVVLNHAVYQVAVYTYGVDDEETKKHAWKEDEIGGWWPRAEYPDVVLSRFDAYNSVKLMEYPEKMSGWVYRNVVGEDVG